jgi:FtsH-binding integral membrane protein
MTVSPQPPAARIAAGPQAQAIDRDLQRFLRGVLAKVAGGLALAGGVGHLIASTPGLRELFFHLREDGAHDPIGLTGPGLIVVISPIVALAVLGSGALSRRRSTLLFWSVAAAMGGSFGAVLLAMTGISVATAFAGAAAGFGALALYGYSTHRDLGAWGAFLTAGVVGLLAALVLNLFLASPALTFALNAIGVFVFAGLIAYDMQRLKLIHGQARAKGQDLEVASNNGALLLFLDFANLFQFLLAFMGARR